MKKLILTLGILTLGNTFLSAQVTCSAWFEELTDTSLTASFVCFNANLPRGTTQYRAWDFGDGQTTSYVGRKLFTDHTYSLPGWYTVTQNVVVTDFRGDTLCISSSSDSIPVGVVHNPNNWVAELSVPDTVKGYSVMGIDSSGTFTSSVPVSEKLFFYEKRSQFSYFGSGVITSHVSGSGSGWLLRNQGDNLVCMSKQYYDTSGALVNETYDCKNVFVDAPLTASATISYSQNTSTLGEVNFTANCMSSPTVDTTIHREYWQWTFGDGAFGSGVSPTHVYNGAGEFRVVLYYSVINKTTGVAEGYSRVVDTVDVQASTTCLADFTYNISANKLINTSSSFYSPQTSGLSYHWLFEDGTTSTQENPNHILTKQVNPIRLIQTVEDAQYNVLCSDTTIHIVYSSGVINPSCIAEYTVDSAQSGNSVITIVNTSTPQPGAPGFAGISYTWDFGDGTTSNQAYPTHVYADSGMYNLCLTIETEDNNGDSCTATFCKTVGVDSLGNIIYKNSGGFTINVVAPNTVSEEEQKLLDIDIYPNPASGYVNVQGLKEGADWRLYNLQGSMEAAGHLDTGNSIIDLDGKKTGLYILRLVNGNTSKTVKLYIK